jgi:hypothetical protein
MGSSHAEPREATILPMVECIISNIAILRRSAGFITFSNVLSRKWPPASFTELRAVSSSWVAVDEAQGIRDFVGALFVSKALEKYRYGCEIVLVIGL